jgi:hypothetical protein
MKITIDVDCTPEEARRALGLPDIAPMQEAMIADIQKRMQEALTAMDPETLFRTWLPAGIEGFEQFQKAFWSQMTGAAGKKGGSE